MLRIEPISFHEANAYVFQNHRHNTTTAGNRFSLACYDDNRLCGVAICCRPVARKLDDGLTLEIARVCVDGTRNACSKLYGACVRVAKAMGYRKVITYTLQSEDGASLKASNFACVCENAGGLDWNVPSRSRGVQMTLFEDERRYPNELKKRWEITLIH